MTIAMANGGALPHMLHYVPAETKEDEAHDAT